MRLAALRIIPARAGFTPISFPIAYPNQDHPRSRGVYALSLERTSTVEGSSPLARGLPFSYPQPTLTRGIIPARAGFTRHMTHRTQTHPDHPRSRGVYATTSSSSQ